MKKFNKRLFAILMLLLILTDINVIFAPALVIALVIGLILNIKLGDNKNEISKK